MDDSRRDEASNPHYPYDPQYRERFGFMVDIFQEYFILWAKSEGDGLKFIWEAAFRQALKYAQHGKMDALTGKEGLPVMDKAFKAILAARQAAPDEKNSMWWHTFVSQSSLKKDLET